MANRKLGSPESALHILQSRVKVIKGWDKKEVIEFLLPQRVEDGKMYNFKNNVIMSHNGEDCIFHEDTELVQNTNRITDKFLNTIFTPIETYLGVVEEDEDGPGPDDIEEELETVNEEDTKFAGEIDLVAEVSDLIKADEMKKAKKVLKANKDNSSYKEAKKLFDNPNEVAAAEVKEETIEDFVSIIDNMLASGNIKEAKKYLKENKDNADYKEAKKLIKKAGK